MHRGHGHASGRIREGIPHRGTPDWNNMSFVEDGIGLEEVDLVPANHPEQRTCQNLGSANGCKEVPVEITDDLQIQLFLAEGESNNVRFDKLPNSGDSNFTLAVNITNMSYAHLELNFPLNQGLRMINYSIQDTITNNDGSVNVSENTALSGPESVYLPDGRLRVNQVITYAASESPMLRDSCSSISRRWLPRRMKPLNGAQMLQKMGQSFRYLE